MRTWIKIFIYVFTRREGQKFIDATLSATPMILEIIFRFLLCMLILKIRYYLFELPKVILPQKV